TLSRKNTASFAKMAYRLAYDFSRRAGVMECWSNGVMGIQNHGSAKPVRTPNTPTFQYSITPIFSVHFPHGSSITRFMYGSTVILGSGGSGVVVNGSSTIAGPRMAPPTPSDS